MEGKENCPVACQFAEQSTRPLAFKHSFKLLPVVSCECICRAVRLRVFIAHALLPSPHLAAQLPWIAVSHQPSPLRAPAIELVAPLSSTSVSGPPASESGDLRSWWMPMIDCLRTPPIPLLAMLARVYTVHARHAGYRVASYCEPAWHTW